MAFDPITAIANVANTVLSRVLPDKTANDAAKAQLAQMVASGELAQAATEMTSAAEIIKAEAQSQSWLPRNVRPLLLLLWGLVISLNQVVPVIARFWLPGLQPFPVDPWVYKLTAIGFTGYVGARTWEKVTNSDN